MIEPSITKIFRINRSVLWVVIGLTLIGFAVTAGLSIREASTDAERLKLFYTYGSVVLTLLIVLGLFLLLFPTGLLSSLKKSLKSKG
jgi:uncharacterized membrane protein YhaH (DUF805 family)